jgi:ABC-type transport system substrate-binding protein
MRDFRPSEPPNFDPVAGGGSGAMLSIAPWPWQRLTRFVLATHPNHADGTVVGDFVDSWEVSPDKLQVTFKLRQGHKWDPAPPVNGREVSSADIAFTWNKLTTIGNYKNDILYDGTVAPDAPVESLTVIDDKTFAMKLKKPSSALFAELAQIRTSFWVQPMEADGQYDSRNEIHGSGPWMLSKFEPSIGSTWARNPNYFMNGLPYFDEWAMPTISEHSTQLVLCFLN